MSEDLASQLENEILSRILSYSYDAESGKHTLRNGKYSRHAYKSRHDSLRNQILRFVDHLDTKGTVFLSPTDACSRLELQQAFEGRQQIRYKGRAIRYLG